MAVTKEQIQQLLQSHDPTQAFALFRELQMDLEGDRIAKDERNEAERWLVVLQLLSIPLLPLEKVCEVLKNYVGFAIKHPDIDVVDLLGQHFAPYAGPGVDRYKQEVFQALEESKEKLGDFEITLPDGKTVPATVGGWLALHVAKVGRGRKKKNDSISYAAQDRSVAKLGGEEKRIVRELIRLYNLLQPLPLDDERLLKLGDEDVWWGVDMPIGYKGLLLTRDDQVIDEATYVKMQRSKAFADEGKGSLAPSATSTSATPAGSVPSLAPSPIRSRAESVKTSSDIARRAESPSLGVVRLDIKRALEKDPHVGDIRVSSAPFTNADGHPTAPTVRAWLQDYTRLAGLDYHTLREREAYFFESTNAKALSAEEKTNIKAVLQSFDDGRALPFTNGFRAIDFRESKR